MHVSTLWQFKTKLIIRFYHIPLIRTIVLKQFKENFIISFSGESISHTKSDNGWWKVTLKEVSYISYIDVYNRFDKEKGQARLKGAEVKLDGNLIWTIPQVAGKQKYTIPVDKDGKLWI